MAAAPPDHAPASHTRPEQVRVPLAAWAALAWSALLLGLGLGWAAGLVPAGVPETEGMGSLFIGLGADAAPVLALGLGAAGVVCALLMLRPGSAGGHPAEVTAWAMAAATLVVFIDGSLLSLLGYLFIIPIVGWFIPGLFADVVSTVAEPVQLTLLFCTAGVIVWLVAALAHHRAVRRACSRCGRRPGWTAREEQRTRVRALRTGRIWVAVACVTALLYPALRLPWIFGIYIGLDEQTVAALTTGQGQEGLAVGLGLGGAGLVGVVLMLGLVRNWGVRFPRWMVGLAGRRVPVSLAVVPAALVTLAMVAMGRSIVVELAQQQQSLMTAVDAHIAVFASMGIWGAALGVATAAYALRRRAECTACGRGAAEADPASLRPKIERAHV